MGCRRDRLYGIYRRHLTGMEHMGLGAVLNISKASRYFLPP